MKSLVEYIIESENKEWRIWGVIKTKDLKRFQERIKKLNIVDDNSDYTNEIESPMSNEHGYFIDLVIKGPVKDTRIADDFNTFAGMKGSKQVEQSYNAYLELHKKQ